MLGSVEVAERVRDAVFGLQWPPDNRDSSLRPKCGCELVLQLKARELCAVLLLDVEQDAASSPTCLCSVQACCAGSSQWRRQRRSSVARQHMGSLRQQQQRQQPSQPPSLPLPRRQLRLLQQSPWPTAQPLRCVLAKQLKRSAQQLLTVRPV